MNVLRCGIVRLIASLLLVLSGLPALGCAAGIADDRRTMMVEGIQRHYYLHVPPPPATGQRLPVFIPLHGGGGNSQSLAWAVKLGKAPYFVVNPDAVQGSWSFDGFAPPKGKRHGHQDRLFIEALIDDVLRSHPSADPDRVFLMGFSRGGMLALHLADDDQLSRKINSVAVVMSSLPEMFAEGYRFARPTSIMMVHGTKDPLVPYEGSLKAGHRPDDKAFRTVGIEEFIATAVALNGCSTGPIETAIPDKDLKDGCTAIERRYTGGRAGTEVVLIRVDNGGHTVPGGGHYLPKAIIGELCKDFSAHEKMIEFLLRQPPKKPG